jgi:MFS family permease
VITCVVRSAILLLTVPLYAWSGTMVSLYSVVAVLAVADLVFGPARSALLPELVRAGRLLRANAILWVLGVIGTLVGLLGGGWLFDYLSWESSFYANSLGYLCAAAVMVPVAVLYRRSRPVPLARRRSAPGPLATVADLARAVADSVRLIRTDRHIAVSLCTQTALFAMGGVLSVIAVARIQELAPAEGRALFLALVGAALVVGMIAGSGILGLFRGRVSVQRTIAVATIISGVGVTGLGRTETLLPLSIWGGVLGLAVSPVFVVTETLIQHKSPREHLGRVFTAREALIKTAYLAAAAAGTLVNAFISKPSILVTLGLFLALLGVVLERTRWLTTDELEEQEGT